MLRPCYRNFGYIHVAISPITGLDAMMTIESPYMRVEFDGKTLFVDDVQRDRIATELDKIGIKGEWTACGGVTTYDDFDRDPRPAKVAIWLFRTATEECARVAQEHLDSID